MQRHAQGSQQLRLPPAQEYDLDGNGTVTVKEMEKVCSCAS